eukprot:24605-Rhodomonas_salina.1
MIAFRNTSPAHRMSVHTRAICTAHHPPLKSIAEGAALCGTDVAYGDLLCGTDLAYQAVLCGSDMVHCAVLQSERHHVPCTKTSVL